MKEQRVFDRIRQWAGVSDLAVNAAASEVWLPIDRQVADKVHDVVSNSVWTQVYVQSRRSDSSVSHPPRKQKPVDQQRLDTALAMQRKNLRLSLESHQNRPAIQARKQTYSAVLNPAWAAVHNMVATHVNNQVLRRVWNQLRDQIRNPVPSLNSSAYLPPREQKS